MASGRLALVNAALIASGLVGATLGLTFALLAPVVSPNLSPLRESVASPLLFAGGAALTGVAYVLDQTLIGLLRGGLQFARNVVFSAAKLLGLVLIAAAVTDPGAPWIYSAWGAGIAVSLILVPKFLRRDPGETLRPDLPLLGKMRRAAASHAAVNLALETADLAMPVVVLSLLTPTDNAGFYIAWLVVGFLIMIPFSLCSVAYALGSADAASIESRFAFTFRLSLALGLLAVILLVPLADPVLGVFGEGYAETATTALQILALGVFPLVVKTHYVAIHRVRRTLPRALPVAWMGTALELGGGAVGAVVGGIDGVAIGWLAGLLVESAVMAPDVIRVCAPGLARR
jgi:O-antigen/teichoic acid export membrane protein